MSGLRAQAICGGSRGPRPGYLTLPIPRTHWLVGPCCCRGCRPSPRSLCSPVFWTLAASACSGWHCPDTLTRDGNGCSDGDTSANSPRGQHHLHGCHGEFCLAAPLGPCPSPPLPFPLKAPELFGAVRLVCAASEHPPAWGSCNPRHAGALRSAWLLWGRSQGRGPWVAGRAPCSCRGFRALPCRSLQC